MATKDNESTSARRPSDDDLLLRVRQEVSELRRQLAEERRNSGALGGLEAGSSLDRAGDAVDRAIPPRPAQPPAAAAAADRPVLVVVAGPEGSGTGAVSLLVGDLVARRDGPVAHLGNGYPPDHPAYESIRRSGAKSLADRHAVAVQHTVDRRINAILYTRAEDPQALAQTMLRYREAGYRVEFAAVATPEPLRGLNVLEARRGQRRGRSAEPVPDRLAEAASRAAVIAHNVTVFRPNGKALAHHHGPDGAGGRTPAQSINAEYQRTWTAEESLRFAVRTARLIARDDPARRQALQSIVETAHSHHTQRWQGLFDLAANPPAPKHAWYSGAKGRIRQAGALAALSDSQLEDRSLDAVRRYGEVQREANRLTREARKLQEGAAEVGTQASKDKIAVARADSRRAQRSANEHRQFVADALGEERRRAQLSPRQREAEVRAYAKQIAQARPPAAQRAYVGVPAPTAARGSGLRT